MNVQKNSLSRVSDKRSNGDIVLNRNTRRTSLHLFTETAFFITTPFTSSSTGFCVHEYLTGPFVSSNRSSRTSFAFLTALTSKTAFSLSTDVLGVVPSSRPSCSSFHIGSVASSTPPGVCGTNTSTATKTLPVFQPVDTEFSEDLIDGLHKYIYSSV
ncbi:hypothetical protein CPB83DRAFT_316822 [Crepidotus variabilis]|uniref:Uncharacterized protein n=1 Tax=Crepidotus variabilis TaxID=179855 RepID=A0A9P6BD73_9AGAR|nr:hypothetical protein CPB83DRAFT_316822 [Crepidotus variabilis]